jgi:outer membrane protein assembly factor BamB
MVIAVNDKNGKEIWGTEIGPPFKGGHNGSRCTPTIDGDRVYALGPQGHLVCLKTATGELVWKRSFKEDFEGRISNWGYCESPLVDGDKLICSPGGPKAGIVALDKKTGRELWRCAIPPNKKWKLEGAPLSSIAISRGAGVKQYIQAMQEGVVGVDAESGKLLWHYDRQSAYCNMCTPMVRGDYVFVPIGWGSGSVLLKLVRAGDGVKFEEVYFLKGEKARIQSGGAVLVGDYVYTSHAGNGSPKCIEFMTGKSMWKTQRGPGHEAAMAYADGHLYYRYDNGVMALIAATPNKYQLKGTFEIPNARGQGMSHPSISNGRLYVRDGKNLYCYDLRK